MIDTTVFSIGHSTHSFDVFLNLLNTHKITAVADVRSVPWSRHFSHFNRRELKVGLRLQDIEYRFFGKMLGGRPEDPALFSGLTANYEAMAKTSSFESGISRVILGAKKHSLALMCSEHDPLDCHRCLLVGRSLAQQGVGVKHILASGNISTQEDIERELLQSSGRFSDDLYLPHEELLNAAYRARAMKVAYKDRSVEQFEEDHESDVEYG